MAPYSLPLPLHCPSCFQQNGRWTGGLCGTLWDWWEAPTWLPFQVFLPGQDMSLRGLVDVGCTKVLLPFCFSPWLVSGGRRDVIREASEGRTHHLWRLISDKRELHFKKTLTNSNSLGYLSLGSSPRIFSIFPNNIVSRPRTGKLARQNASGNMQKSPWDKEKPGFCGENEL